jgi:hypothetical protein
VLYQHRLQQRAAYREWLPSLRPTHELTFNFGTRVLPVTAHAKMLKVCKWVEERGLGRRWYTKSSGRLIVIGFPEHLDTNTHWHCVAVAHGKLPLGLYDAKTELWRRLAPRGQLNVERIDSIQKAASYFTKELHRPGRADEVFVYRGCRT